MKRRLRLPFLSSFDRLWSHLSKPARVAVIVALIAAAALIPLALPTYWQGVLFFPVGVYVLLALGLNVVVGMAGLLDLGYVAFYAVGAYTTALLTTDAGWDPWLALPFSIAVAMLAGVILGAPTLRLRGDYLAIVTLGFGEIVRIVALNSEPLGQSRGIVGIPHPASLGPIEFKQLPLPYYYLTLTAIVIAVISVLRLTRSRVGRSWAALREDEDAAEVMGVNTFSMKLWAFAIGASTGGLAGWLYAIKVSFISPDNFPFFFSVIILASVVLGGMGSIPGVISGAFALAFLPEYLRNVAAGDVLADAFHFVIGGTEATITEYRVLLFGLALVLMMILRPQGLLPNRRRAAELHDPTTGTHLATQTPDVESRSGDGSDVSPNIPTLSAEFELPLKARPSVDGVAMSIDDVNMSFGGVHALRGVSITINAGQLYGVIGPNGAGKTTLFNCITGVFQPQQGSIAVAGRSLIGKRPHKVTRLGVARTFQNIRLFPEMTVLENVKVGVDSRHKSGVISALLRTSRQRREEREAYDIAQQLLQFVGVAGHGNEFARELSYGDQRRLEIARALATNPSVLLLDEPAAGMNPSEKQELASLIRRLSQAKVTIILIEHDMSFVMGLCDRISVLDFGEKIAEGTPDEIRNDPRVIEAYLGVADAS